MGYVVGDKMKNKVLHIALHITTGASGDPCTVALVRVGGTQVYNLHSQHRVAQLSALLGASERMGWEHVSSLDAGKYGSWLYYAPEPFVDDENGYEYNGQWDNYTSDEEIV
jgi:hypothetical protein